MTLKKRLVITIILMVIIPVMLLALIAGVMYAVFLLDGGAPMRPPIVLDEAAIDNAFGPGGRLFKFAIIFGASAVLIVGASFITGILHISRKILPPMKELSNAAKRISAGELDFEILGSNVAEISELCSAFDEMRKRLRANIAAEVVAERERNLMLAHISHDLRTPVTSIKGYAQGLLDGVATTEQMKKHYLETISAKASSMQRMIEQMSDFSELELGRLTFNFTSADIVEFLRTIGDDFRTDLTQIDADFSTDLPRTTIPVRIDREKLGRVFANVLSNAIKYRSEERRLSVSLRAEQTPTGIHIVTADNGRGVAPDELGRVFEGFYRSDPARSNTAGHGLGLAISRQIISQHNGSIWMTEHTGGGIEIHITLPREEVANENTDNRR